MLKLFTLRLSFFILGTSILYFSLLMFSGTFFPNFINKNLKFKLGLTGFMYSRLKDADSISDSIDILFIGSSHAYRGFDTRFFIENGLRSFNLGSSNQTPKQTELLLEHYLPIIKPRLLIIEVYPETFEMDGLESSVDIISNSGKNSLAIKEAFRQNNIISWNTLIYRLGHKILNQSFQEDTLFESDHYISGQGYVESLSPHQYIPESIKKNAWKPRSEQIESFEKIITLMNDLKISYFLVQAPMTKNCFESYSNNNAIDNTLAKFGNYINFNQFNLNLVDTFDFYDSNHLNQNGVIKFNSVLLDIIKKSK